MNKDIVLVTGIWDLGRDRLSEGWSRNFQHYLDKFDELLKIDENLIIFGDNDLKKFVFERRSEENTQFIERPVSWFIEENEFFHLIDKIRKNEKWYSLSGWLKESTQAKLAGYNPLVMSKMFLLHDAKIMDKFNSKYMFWIDGGITNTVHSGYFTHDKVFNNLTKYVEKFSFVCFPYKAENEIHGFEYNKLNEIAENKVLKVARGGFFGGPKQTISDINGIYHGLLKETLSEGYMGTEESIFSIMVHKNAKLINYFSIEENGLMGKFFEDLKNNNLEIKSEYINELDSKNVALYVITFNSPNQFKTLIKSMIQYDSNFINKPEKFLLDNSTDQSTFEQYSILCEEYGFEHIKKDNLGICGGRQFISEHAETNNFDYHFFFEDDMFLDSNKEKKCSNGFNSYVDDLYDISLNIIHENKYDFLKLSFSEFYGDNKTQWSWYNVPQNVRVKFWPNKNKLPKIGLDKNAPKTLFKNIGCYDNLSFIDGEIYYCNWPQIVSKYGNRKMFLNTKWNHPYEQTWMSHIYQETKKGNINPALLLLTPISHNRFDHYDSELRKES
jgi:hypothetical protein